MALTSTERNANSRQLTVDYQKKILAIRNNEFKPATYENITGAAQSVAVGQIMGQVDGATEYVVCKSAAVDGSQVPKAISMQEVDAAAAAATVTPFSVLISGEVNLNHLVFDGADDLDTQVTSQGGDEASMRDWLETKGVIFIDVEDGSQFDN